MSTQVYLVDASLYIFRAYHSLPMEWQDAEGWPTHAAHGFASFLMQLLEHARPQHVAVCFDEAFGSCYRHEIYPAYKANREPPDATLVRQFAYCRAVARSLGLLTLSNPRFEADDLIGSLAVSMRRHGHKILVISADKDLTQLLHVGDAQWDFGRDQRYCPVSVEKRFGVRPDQMADLLALAGDPVDNIPGVRGIGRATAAKLLREFGNLDGLYLGLDRVGAMRFRGASGIAARLSEQREIAFLSQQLTRIHCAAPVPDDPAELQLRRPHMDHLSELFAALGFGPYLRRRAAAIESQWGT